MASFVERRLQIMAALLVCTLATAAHARPPVPPEQYERMTAEIESIREQVDGRADKAAKHELLKRAFAEARGSRVRVACLTMAAEVGADRLESLLLDATSNHDVMARLKAVNLLGSHGSPAAIDRLLEITATPGMIDRSRRLPSTSVVQRAAYFALAEIGLRHEDAKAQLVGKLKAQEVINAVLEDPKTQSLYILTRDERLIEPFFERLKSEDPHTRQRGVTAFRLLKLTEAPAPLVAMMDDPSADVRSWAALTLGEIGDPATADRLIRAAKDEDEGRYVRANAIDALGRMRVERAEPLLRSMLEEEFYQAVAAIALSRITGERHPLVPEGYALDLD